MGCGAPRGEETEEGRKATLGKQSEPAHDSQKTLTKKKYTKDAGEGERKAIPILVRNNSPLYPSTKACLFVCVV